MQRFRAAVCFCIDGFFCGAYGLQKNATGVAVDFGAAFGKRSAVGWTGPVFAVGTAFVSGTHIAHILSWLQGANIYRYCFGKAQSNGFLTPVALCIVKTHISGKAFPESRNRCQINKVNPFNQLLCKGKRFFVTGKHFCTAAGGDANVVATAAKAAGVTIYIIGLSGNGGIDETALREWSSQPSDDFVSIAPSDAELEAIFGQLAQTITSPGATNIVLNDFITDCFRILSVTAPTKGTATLVNERQIRWTIAELGATATEEAVLRFTVEHLGICEGLLSVNESVDYDDAQGNTVDFGDPQIQVTYGTVIIPEPCPVPVDVTIEGCEDEIEIDAGEVLLESLGRVLKLDVTVPNVCPGRRVALAVILTEVDDEDNEFRRGMKTLVIPAHDAPSCRDVVVRCIRFVLPEELDVSGSPDRLCDQRNFKVRFIANYIDAGFTCCTLGD